MQTPSGSPAHGLGHLIDALKARGHRVVGPAGRRRGDRLPRSRFRCRRCPRAGSMNRMAASIGCTRMIPPAPSDHVVGPDIRSRTSCFPGGRTSETWHRGATAGRRTARRTRPAAAGRDRPARGGCDLAAAGRFKTASSCTARRSMPPGYGLARRRRLSVVAAHCRLRRSHALLPLGGCWPGGGPGFDPAAHGSR